MGLLNLAGPFLKRHDIVLPSLSVATLLRRFRRGEDEDDDLDFGDEDDLNAARDFAETSFVAGDTSLLARRSALGDEDDEELDEELVQVLDEVAEEELEPADAAGEDLADEAEGPVIYTVSAEAPDEAEDEESPEEDDVEDDEDEEDDAEDSDEDGDEEEAEETSQPEVQVVAGGGDGNDMMSLFGESADAGAKEVAAWREDLPDVSIEELLAEARAVSQQIKDKKRNAA